MSECGAAEERTADLKDFVLHEPGLQTSLCEDEQECLGLRQDDQRVSGVWSLEFGVWKGWCYPACPSRQYCKICLDRSDEECPSWLSRRTVARRAAQPAAPSALLSISRDASHKHSPHTNKGCIVSLFLYFYMHEPCPLTLEHESRVGSVGSWPWLQVRARD